MFSWLFKSKAQKEKDRLWDIEYAEKQKKKKLFIEDLKSKCDEINRTSNINIDYPIGSEYSIFGNHVYLVKHEDAKVATYYYNYFGKREPFIIPQKSCFKFYYNGEIKTIELEYTQLSQHVKELVK